MDYYGKSRGVLKLVSTYCMGAQGGEGRGEVSYLYDQ